jgi:hypothetical protein
MPVLLLSYTLHRLVDTLYWKKGGPPMIGNTLYWKKGGPRISERWSPPPRIGSHIAKIGV